MEVWELAQPADSPHFTAWATHFRQQYCPDTEIDALREGTGLSRSEYLTQLVFPDERTAPGPAVRAGDFGELLVADFAEHILGFWVPRGKYADKASRDESVKGVDIIGIRPYNPSTASATDCLIAFEVKAQLTGRAYVGKLQDAADDSAKDFLRRALTLNATKRRLQHSGDTLGAITVQRFQNPADAPYEYRSGAVAVLSSQVFDPALLQASTNVASHPNKSRLSLLVFTGDDLMTLVHALYQKAADAA